MGCSQEAGEEFQPLPYARPMRPKVIIVFATIPIFGDIGSEAWHDQTIQGYETLC